MPANKKVKIRIKSHIDDSIIIQEVQGEVYLKEDSTFFRYEEPEASLAMVNTTTTVKASPQEIKVFRHGGLNSEQTFKLREQCIGFYQTPQGDLELETYTDEMWVDLNEGLGQLFWSYDLWINQELTGKYKLQIESWGKDESQEDTAESPTDII